MMGVDTKVSFPPQTRVDDVARVAALLLGHKGGLVEKGTSNHRVTVCDVEGISYRCGGIPASNGVTTIAPDWVTIELTSSGRSLYYSFEGHTLHYDDKAPWGEDGRRYMSMGHGVISVALAKALVDFFGGEVDFNDCDSIEVDYEKARAPWKKGPTDGEAWDKWQKKLAAVKPLTWMQIAEAQQQVLFDQKYIWGAAHVEPREDGKIVIIETEEEVA